jgi:hypothetical protein
MKTKLMFFSVVFILQSMVIFSQIVQTKPKLTDRRNQIGIQFNPNLDTNDDYVANIYSIRYGYRLLRPLTIGSELTLFRFRPNNYYGDYFSVTAGIYSRWSFRPERRIHGFIEISPFYQILYTKEGGYYGKQFGGALAPGISAFSKNGKFSIDLYYRISTCETLSSRTGLFSYKVNFHF